MKRRDKKRAAHIIELIEDMQDAGEGLYFRWLADDQLAWEVRFVYEGRTFTATHGSLELALEWAYEQAEFDEEARSK